MNVLDFLGQFLRYATIWDALDIAIVAFGCYYILLWMRKNNGSRVARGLILFLLLLPISTFLNLRVVKALVLSVLQIGAVALVIVFQPELRRLLERFGRAELGFFHGKDRQQGEEVEAIRQTVAACSTMSWNKTGALIVFEREDDVSSFAENGTPIDAKVTDQLLMNLFYNKAPLHDGAVIISNGRVRAAGCVLPLSDNFSLSKELGTRHRAAVGMSEHYDCPCVVVSEETGSISLTKDGVIKRHLSAEMLERMLMAELVEDDKKHEDKNWKQKAKRFAANTTEKVKSFSDGLKKEKK